MDDVRLVDAFLDIKFDKFERNKTAFMEEFDTLPKIVLIQYNE